MAERSNIVAFGPSRDLHGLSDAQRLQLLVEAVHDYALYLLDADGFVATWNSGAEKMKGYRPVEIMGQHFSRFFTAEDQANNVPGNILRECRAAGRVEGEGWRVRKDGSRFCSNFVITSVHDENGAVIGFAKITRDITELMAAQNALGESERRFRLLVQGIFGYAIYMLDPSGVITNWNEGAERMKGYEPNEIIGHHFSRFYTAADRAAGLPARILEIARKEGRFESEGWRVRKDGGQFWASVTIDAIRSEDGELLGFAKITRDITERMAAQRALRDSERQLRLFIQGVVDYALYMLDPNGIVTSWNPGAERIKGYKADEIIGQHFSRFYTDRDRADGMPARALYTALREGRYEAEAWRVRKDGSLFWAHAVLDPIRDEEGKLIGFAKITRDATHRRNSQLALEEAHKQRAQTQKMEALGHLTGGVAHDFNNLLMVVSGYVQTAKKLLADDPRGARAAQAIELAAQRGQALTRQLLSFARRQPLNPVVIDLKDRFDALRPLLNASLGRDAKLVLAADTELWPIKTDAAEFDLSLLNLTLNASDAMPDGGIITLNAENVSLSPQDTPQRLAGEFVAITVSDTGRGIPADVLERVFDPFFTTKKAGSGLGLSQVHGMVHQSGGTVTIRSEVGTGTQITLYFPRATGAFEPAPLAPAVTRQGSSVLLVEDNPDVAGASAALLEELGYTVHSAGSAEEALQALDEHSFDLVVTDIVMAGSMNGVALAQVIRKRLADVPIILVTGYSEAAAAAANEFTVLRKPYQMDELAHAAADQIKAIARRKRGNVVRLRD